MQGQSGHLRANARRLIGYDPEDDYPRSLAGLVSYDVLLVNPIRDGMNMVAKEGPLVNQRDGVLVLSRQAGAWDELSEGVRPDHFKIGNIRQRLDVLKEEPWPDFFTLRQRLPL